jgi:MFS family permease
MKKETRADHDANSVDLAPTPGQNSNVGARSFKRTFVSFQNYNYRLYWSGQLLSRMGSWITNIAQAWLVLQLTNSSFALGLVTALQALPITFLALFGGVLADRFPKRRVLIVTQSVMAIESLVIGVLITTHHIHVWQIYILASVVGLATAFDNPTRQAFVSEMVGPENLPNAVALNSSLFNAARIVGPAVGGALIAAFTIDVSFYVDAVSFLAVIGGLILMRPAEFYDVPVPVRGHVFTRMREGIGYAVKTPAVLLPLILLSFIGTFGYNFTVILPLIAKYVLGTGALGFGSLTTAIGIGALTGALVIAYFNLPSERLLLFAGTAFTILLGLLAFSSRLSVTLGILLLLGFASITYTATTNTRIQISAPGELRGRVISLYILLNAGTTPIGALLIGTLASNFNVRLAIGVMTSLCAVGLLVSWLYYARHANQTPTLGSSALNRPAPGD